MSRTEDGSKAASAAAGDAGANVRFFAVDALQPQTVELSDGTLFTVFTGTKVVKTGGRRSFIGGTRWAPDRRPLPDVDQKRRAISRRGSWGPSFRLPPLTPRFNFRTADQSPWSKPPADKKN